MAGLYDGGTTRNQWYGGLDNINEERRPDTKGFSDLTSGDVQHLVARHWNLPDLTAGFQTIDGNALTYFSDVDLRDSGVVAKSTRRLRRLGREREHRRRQRPRRWCALSVIERRLGMEKERR